MDESFDYDVFFYVQLDLRELGVQTICTLLRHLELNVLSMHNVLAAHHPIRSC
jgi:hypothetical protein